MNVRVFLRPGKRWNWHITYVRISRRNFQDFNMQATGHNPKDDYPHWGRIYIAVVITTVAVIFLLWLFPRWFTL